MPSNLGAVGNRLPVARDVERQGVPSLQVGLIETRECQARTRRHEQCVEELVVPVERLVTGRELDNDLVLPRPRRAAGMTIWPFTSGNRSPAGGTDAPQAIGGLREVQDDPVGAIR